MQKKASSKQKTGNVIKHNVIRPCPFCGSKAELLPMLHPFDHKEQVGYSIICIMCRASVYEITNYKKQAVAKWNKRTEHKWHSI